MADAGNQPFLNMNLFVYDEAQQRHLHAHGAREPTRDAHRGQPARLLRRDRDGSPAPAPTAKNFSVEYASVIVFGCGRVVDDSDEATYGLQCLMDKYAPHLQPGEDYRPSSARGAPDHQRLSHRHRGVVGQNQRSRPEDFPGAFTYTAARAYSMSSPVVVVRSMPSGRRTRRDPSGSAPSTITSNSPSTRPGAGADLDPTGETATWLEARLPVVASQESIWLRNARSSARG